LPGKIVGKVVLIAGKTSGFGRASAILYAKEGANVTVADDPNVEEDKEGARLIIEIFDTIRNLNQDEKITMLLVKQNLKASLQMSHRGYVLKDGRIVLQGMGKELGDEHTTKAYLGM